MSADVWDWTFRRPDVQKVPSFNKETSEHAFQELLICGCVVVWGDVLPKGMWSHKENQIARVFFASEVITSKAISQLSRGAGGHSLILSLGLFLQFMGVSPVTDLLWALWGCCNNLEAIGQSRICQWIKGDRVKSGSSEQTRTFKTNVRAKIQISTLYENARHDLCTVGQIWSTPPWPATSTGWALTPVSLLIYCRLVYLWISPVWSLFYEAAKPCSVSDRHHFPLLQPRLTEMTHVFSHVCFYENGFCILLVSTNVPVFATWGCLESASPAQLG